MRHTLQTAALLLLALSLHTQARGQDLRTLFRSIPEQVLPHFSVEQKGELLEVFDKCQSNGTSTESTPVTNNYGGASFITTITADYMHLQLDEEVTLQVKLLHDLQGKPLTSFVLTSLLEPNISVLLFYDELWQQKPTESYFQRPANREFVRDLGKKEQNEIKAKINEIGPFTLKYQWLKDEAVLLVENTTLQTEEMKKLYPTVAEDLTEAPLRYKWANGELTRK